MTLSKSKIKFIQSLKLKKFRQINQCFVAEGNKIVNEVLNSKNWALHSLYTTPSCLETNKKVQSVPEKELFLISEKELKKISFLSTPNEVLAIVKIPEQKPLEGLNEQLSIYLDDIRDPGNMGTIIRIADWFGIHTILLSKTCVDVYNPKVVQASMGSFLRVDCNEISFSKIANTFPELLKFGAVLEGENIFQATLSNKGIIVIGNESKGISKDILSMLTHKISIPSENSIGAESLNAGIATGIICSLFRNRIS